MSVFSGLTNQISGWVANRGNKEDDGTQPAQENGDAAADGVQEGNAAGGGGVSGLAQGLMSKAMAAKEGLKEKATNFQTPNLSGIGSNIMHGVTNLLPGRKEEEVPTPPDPNPPSELGEGAIEEN
jgi:hypothetical protein